MRGKSGLLCQGVIDGCVFELTVKPEGLKHARHDIIRQFLAQSIIDSLKADQP